LLYDERMTIAGARQCLKREQPEMSRNYHPFVGEIRAVLYEVLEMLK